ncbi:AtpZ/AtpI family protein [Hwanghaeella grinnelliae]|uniref:AtpZ/AtpI family protein n=1 Tax=Hwanghaeella grinnelliae TaxID=2500179 RepID=A0A437QMQ2_9PROT|nr:AtpZ/AtpI family protein [Hwanghaeella grinnelliae]RVU35818.1 AtpZ/AtpI family protein [Hwanghaeella grinnelliae]
MAKPPPNGGQTDLHHAVKLREERNERWRREGERSIWQNLSMIGALGWLIVTPILIGIFAGRWLDRTFETGIFYSGALIFLGAVLGAYLAWHRIQSK